MSKQGWCRRQLKRTHLSEYTIVTQGDSFPGFLVTSYTAVLSVFLQCPRGFISYSRCQCFTPHRDPILLERKLERAEESDSEILKFVLCENLFSNPSPASLPRFWTFHVPFAVSLKLIFFSPTLPEIERRQIPTSSSKSVAVCKKNTCSSKYFSLVPRQSMS